MFLAFFRFDWVLVAVGERESLIELAPLARTPSVSAEMSAAAVKTRALAGKTLKAFYS